MSRTRTVPGMGVIATAALVLIFGNQAVTEWVSRHYPRVDDFWSFLLHKLTWPSWAFTTSDSSARSARQLLAQDLRALFLILFVALILGIAAKAVSGGGAFFLGWASVVFASALAALITGFVAGSSFLGALNAADAGSAYGLFVGWIVGIACTTAKKAG